MSARSLLRAATALALCATAAAPAHAWRATGSRWNARSLPIRYRVNASTAPASLGAAAALAAVEGGFASWQEVSCTAWRTLNAGTTSVRLADLGDGENSVLWVASGWNADPVENPMGDVRGTIGVTQTSRIVGGATAESDISFNAQGFRWNTTGTGGSVDAQSIAVHEEGHFLGLDHTPITAAVMYASYTSGVKRTLHPDDEEGVCALYPGTGTAPADAGVRDATTTPDSGSGGSGGAVGAACSMSSPCARGNTCVCVEATGECFCTRPCSSSSPCPEGVLCARTSVGNICVPDPEGGGTMMMMPGGGGTGDPCTSGAQCSSELCVQTQVGSAFCTQRCVDDCSCPSAYRCAATTSGLNVCVTGANRCAADAGAPRPDASVPRDSAVARDVVSPPVEEDAGTPPSEEDAAVLDASVGDARGGGESPGCACAVPGAPRSSALRGAWSLPWAALALAGAVRARRRARPR